MSRLRSLFPLVVLGSALTWSGSGWAQQDSDKPSRDESGQRESDEGRDTKSRRERRSRIDIPTEDLLREQAEELKDQLRRLTRERLRDGIEFHAPPFHLNLRGDWYPLESRSNDLGARIVPADESLREQLGLPDRQGLVVKSVARGGPAFRIGLKVNDVLTSLADKPLATRADLIKCLKDAGEKVVPLQVLRSGETITIQVKPEVHVTFGPVETPRSRYQLGVQVASLDDALRSQLKLSEQGGLLVSAVEPNSAAEKAGIKKHDILLAVGDQPLKRTEDLVSLIQKSSGKALKFKLLRGGETINVEVTPTAQPDDEDEPDSPESGLGSSDRAVPPFALDLPQIPEWNPNQWEPLMLSLRSERHLGDLRGEVMELRRSIEQFRKSLRSNPDPGRPER